MAAPLPLAPPGSLCAAIASQLKPEASSKERAGAEASIPPADWATAGFLHTSWPISLFSLWNGDLETQSTLHSPEMCTTRQQTSHVQKERAALKNLRQSPVHPGRKSFGLGV